MKRSGTQFKKLNLGKGLRLSLVAIIAIFLGLTVLAPVGSANPSCPTIDEKYTQMGGRK